MGILSKLVKKAAKASLNAAKSAKKETAKHVLDVVGKPKTNAEGIKKIKPVQKSNANSRQTGRKYAAIAGTVSAAGGYAAGREGSKKEVVSKETTIQGLKKDLASLKAALRKARTETAKAKLESRIEKLLRKIATEKEKNKTIDSRVPGVKKSLRPKLRDK
tara:strand:- start:43 stop:525 length:483 start_codon:yes stop_codon:yes gene_type:complete